MNTCLRPSLIAASVGMLVLLSSTPPMHAETTATIDGADALATTPSPRPDPWWTQRHARKLAEKETALATGETIDLVFLGDSITHGWEKSGKEVWAERFAPLGSLNLGYSGDRTEHLLWRLGAPPAAPEDNEIAGLTPKLFVLMIGTNNTGHRQDPPEATAAGIEAIVDRLQELSPESNILLLAVFPRGATADDPLRLLNDGVNERLARLGERDRVEFLDLNDIFLDSNGDLPESVMPDRLHPKEAGYRLWADAIEPHVQRLMAE